MAFDFLPTASSSNWRFECSDLFQDSLAANTVIFADLPERLRRFIEVKLPNPMNARYGKHDRQLTARLKGFWHTHLRDDAVLIYHLKDRCLTLVYIAKHSEIEGKRLNKLADRLAKCVAA